MTRRCSHCSNNGHNSRTCPTRAGGVRLFGVRLTEGMGPMKKSASMGCLSSAVAGADPLRDAGYASDDPAHASCSSNCRNERKKGVPWTEEEHRMFLLGLQKLGKGDWRGIARNFVVSRTPTQVASHAQKYFIRQTNATRRKRRSSLFDIVPEMPMDHLPVLEEQFMLHSPPDEDENLNQVPSLHLSQQQGSELSGISQNNPGSDLKESIPYSTGPIPLIPTFYPAIVPVPLPFWPQGFTTSAREEVGETHEVLKPTPLIPKEPVNADEVVDMSKLNIGEGTPGCMEPSALSVKLLGATSTRQSAFHVNPAMTRPDLNKSNSNAIHAV
ncbi:transcription factor MYBS3-like [Typha latifolia]|uniref:transcription factor MYBS3-like n=1 Tax=Typha latifolia TaxID=4733 RepID=UPI003C2B18F3